MEQGPCSIRPEAGTMLRRITFSLRSIPLALLAAVVLSYGLLLPKLGFYGDDWIYIYNDHLLGAGSFWDFVAIDRPFSAWIYVLTAPFFGANALPYHLLLLALRWGSAVLVWHVLRIAWPTAARPAAWTALLFAVFPGFVQQPIAVQFILHFAVLDLYLLSIIGMLHAAATPRRSWGWLALALLSSLSIFSLEYFAGLELLRPVFLWLMLRSHIPDRRKLLRRIAVMWAPFLAVFAAFLTWRVFIFKFPTYQPDLITGILANPATGLSALALRIITDLKTVAYGVWRQVLSMPSGSIVQVLGLVGGCFVAFCVYLALLRRPEKLEDGAREQEKWPISFLLAGITALIVAGLPLWPASVRVELPFPWDRSTLPFMLGSCLTLVGLLGLVIQPRFQSVLVAAIIALSIGHHYENTQIYQQEWQHLRTYFWQMAYRMPGLEPGTILVSDEIPLYRYSDNDLTPVVNWMYAPDHHSVELPYKYFDLSTRVGSALPGIEEGLPVRHTYRNHGFSGSTSGVLAIYYRTPGCLWVLGPEDGDFPRLPERIGAVLPISHPGRILAGANPAARPPDGLNVEPEPGWCTYFEKMDLAVQQRDWDAAVKLAEEAAVRGLEPADPLELVPALQAFAQSGDGQKGAELAEKILANPENRPFLCARLKQVQADAGNTAGEKTATGLMQTAGCNR